MFTVNGFYIIYILPTHKIPIIYTFNLFPIRALFHGTHYSMYLCNSHDSMYLLL